MAVKKSGLGKGLDALFLDNSTTDGDKPLRLPITEIEPNREQPRKHFDDEALQELCDSIKIHFIYAPFIAKPFADLDNETKAVNEYLKFAIDTFLLVRLFFVNHISPVSLPFQ